MVPRPPTPLGSYGAIRVSEVGPGHYVAKARFRDYDGRLRLVERKGPTARKAENALKEAFRDRQPPQESATLNRESRIHRLAGMWWEDARERGLAHRTYDRYREVLDRCVLPAVGELRIREATPGILEGVVKQITVTRGTTNGKHSRTILSQMFAMATRLDVIPENPMREVSTIRQERAEVRPLTVEQVPEVYGLLSGDVRDVFEVLLGTGARVSEALALRWADVELEPRARVSITGALKSARGVGLFREDRPKSLGSLHRLYVPSFTARALERRPRLYEAVFPSGTGGWWDPNNFRKMWRSQLKGSGYEWVHPHTIRATVGTLLAHTDSLKAASEQLGHSSEAVTIRHYVARLQDAPDKSEALEVLGGPAIQSVG